MGINRDIALHQITPPLELGFSIGEYRDRLVRIRQRMAKDKIDLLYLTAPESLCYVSGYQAEWYQAQSPKAWPPTSGIAVHVDHDDFIMFDTLSEQVMIRYVTVARDTRIFPMHQRRDGTPFIIEELRAAGWLTGNVGLEFHSYRPNPAVSRRFVQAFENAGLKVVDGSDILREVRWLKSPQEMACIAQAAHFADVGHKAARAAIRPGVTELEVYGEIIRAMAAAGSENPGITQPVASGPKANCNHPLASRKKIMPGEQVNVDLSGVYHRYHANIGRTYHVGEPPREVLQAFEKSAKSMAICRDLLRPNLPIMELTRTLKAYYEECGLWGEQSWIGGYEMGIAFPPDWVGNFVYEYEAETDAVFNPGTAVNFESIFFLPRMSGLSCIIDTLAFHADSAAMLSAIPHDLAIISW